MQHSRRDADVWYTPAHPKTAFFRHFSRIGVERPGPAPSLVGAATMVDAVREVAGDRLAPSAAAMSTIGGARVGDRRLDVVELRTCAARWQRRPAGVLWAGENGCPFAGGGHSRQSDAPWSDGGCVPWNEKVPPLVESFDPDVLFVMTGPMELLEHRFAGDPAGRIATDPVFGAAREEQLDALLAVVGSELPVLVADLPPIRRVGSPAPR